jgi:hypothetical protein
MKRNIIKLGLAACGVALFTAAQPASAITTSGVMPANETWSGIVTLTGDVTVPANVTLNILPGTRVQCWDNWDDTAGGLNPNRIELIINGGRLSSIGDSNNPVRFTSSPNVPPAKRGDWYGIRFLTSTNTSTLRWCVVEFAIRGITVTSGNTPVIENCTFQQQSEVGVSYSIPTSLNGCLLSSNGMACEGSGLFMTNSLVRNNGGYGLGAGIYGGATIIDCTVSDNDGHGITANNATIVAIRSTLVGNTGGGMVSGGGNLTATDCVVVSNSYYGILTWGSGSISRCRVEGNEVGVQIEIGGLITDTTVQGNRGGIVLGNGSVVSNCAVRLNGYGVLNRNASTTVLDSVISYNTDIGIESASPIVRGCSIDHNGIGLRLSPSVTASGVSSNNISRNTSYEMWNAGPGVVIATNNFWGEPTTTELTNNVRNLTKIYDSQDNASVGQVLLKPYLITDPTVVPPTVDPNTPADVVAAQGGTATFTVTATSGAPWTYQWRKGTSNLTGETASSLTISPVQLGDAATSYNVIVSNGSGSVTSRWATLTVLIPPAITGQPTNLFLPAGSTAVFHVTATGSAPLSYQWQKEGGNLANAGRVSGATSPDLTISSIQPSDVGNYRVVVTNAVMAVTSLVARLDLPVPPTITTNPATQTVGVGGPATFRVTATGSPPMNYQWYLNGSLISGATGASFTIPTTSADWLGSYQVQVWNSAGTNWSATAGLWLDALKMYAGVNVYGPAGSNCVVQYATNLTAPVTWLPLQSVTIVTNPTVIIDYNSPEQPKRFYRTLPQ